MKSVRLSLITTSGERVFYIEDFEGQALIRPRGTVRSLAGRDIVLKTHDGMAGADPGAIGVEIVGLKVEIDE